MVSPTGHLVPELRVTSVLLCPNVYEERPLRVADPQGSTWEVGSPSPRATTPQRTIVSRAVPPKLGLWSFQHHSQNRGSSTGTAWAAPAITVAPSGLRTKPPDHRWGRQGQLCWDVPTSRSLLRVYADATPGLHGSALVLEALSLHASLYLMRSEIIDVPSSLLHTGHPRPGIGPPAGPPQAPWCSVWAGSIDWRLALSRNTAHLSCSRGLPKVGASKQR